jgi:hypothetical protein
MDWDRIGQSIVASLITSGIILVVLRLVFERGLEHVLDKKLKEYEAQLQERTAVRSKFGERRFEGYGRLAAEVRRTRRTLSDCLEAASVDFRAKMGEYSKATDSLQETLYDNSLTLQQDGLYRSAHTYKVESKTLAKTFNNVLRLREDNDMDKAEALWQASQEPAKRLIAEGDKVANTLQHTIDSVLQGQE